MVKGFFQVYLTEQKLSWIYSCFYCRTHLAYHEDLISKSFQGSQGRAYLFSNVVNVYFSEIKQRVFLTGIHFVADVFCAGCQAILGWKYERAFEPSQRYKEGKIIIELAHMIKDNRWDSDCANSATCLRLSGDCPKSFSPPALVRGEAESICRENAPLWLSRSPNQFGLSDDAVPGTPSCRIDWNPAADLLDHSAHNGSISNSNVHSHEDNSPNIAVPALNPRRRARRVLSALDPEANVVVPQEDLSDTSPLLTNGVVVTRGCSSKQSHISHWLSAASKNGWRKRKRPMHRRAKSSSPSRDPLIPAASDEDTNLLSEENPHRVACSTERLDQ